jgi:Cdc6-like AAA superfamily ATPase
LLPYHSLPSTASLPFRFAFYNSLFFPPLFQPTRPLPFLSPSSCPPAQESVELPLTHPELYEEMGIRPPKGVILYGVPGTGKTLLAKAVANQTSATFLRIVGSELIQKYLGDGPKLVRELFRVAEENAPSIIFIDEIDAIGTKRFVLLLAHSSRPSRCGP